MVNQVKVVADKTNDNRFQQTILLIIAIWLAGLISHFTPLKEWGALVLYVIGSITLAIWRGVHFREWQKIFITGRGIKGSLLWGFIVGVLLSIISLANIVSMGAYISAEIQMPAMVDILLGYKLILLFPLLIVAEEFLWRGLFLSSLIELGISIRTAIGISTLCFMFNHFAVAPVGLLERGMMALMSLPLGVINGLLTIKVKNLWGGVLIHLLTLMTMIFGIFLT